MTDTPTPQITPEQRAELVGWLRKPYDCTHGEDATDMSAAADQLEADSITIATLTAERDALQASLTATLQREAATYERHDAKMDAAKAEIKRLTAALATVFEIASTRHIPDQPAAYAGTELEWATRQYGSLRRDILDAIQKGSAT